MEVCGHYLETHLTESGQRVFLRKESQRSSGANLQQLDSALERSPRLAPHTTMPSAKPTVTTPAEPEAGWATSNPTQQAVQDTEPRAAVLVREGWSEPGAEKSSSLLQTGTRGLQDRQERLSDDCCNNLRAFPQQAGEVSRSPGGKRGTCDDAPQVCFVIDLLSNVFPTPRPSKLVPCGYCCSVFFVGGRGVPVWRRAETSYM